MPEIGNNLALVLFILVVVTGSVVKAFFNRNKKNED